MASLAHALNGISLDDFEFDALKRDYLLTFEPGTSKSSVIPKYDADLLEVIAPSLENGPWIAGSAPIRWFTGDSVYNTDHDIDVFCNSEEQFNAVLKRLSSLPKIYSVYQAYNSKNASTYKISVNTASNYRERGDKEWNVQLIKRRWFNSLQDVFNTFDFRCCAIATDGVKFKSVKGAAKDIKEKRLTLINLNTDAVYKRTIKYWVYGYTPDEYLLNIIQNTPNVKTTFNATEDYDNLS